MSSGVRPAPLSEDQVRAVRDELRQILQSDAFSGSKRCQEFLEFVVERSLHGDWDRLRERDIGAELFNRPIDYETATDPIVRVKANDVRRRLARYNLEAADSSAVRILLPAGSYVPEFSWMGARIADVEQQQDTTALRHRVTRRRWAVAAAAVVLASAAALYLAPRQHSSELEAFWAPAFRDDAPLLVCFGRTESTWLAPRLQREMEDHPESIRVRPGEYMRVFDDATSSGNIRAALSVVGLMHRLNRPSAVRWVSEVQPGDLRSRSIVLIGAFNNPWTMDINRDLRFVFEHEMDGEKLLWVIRDREKPGRKWSLSSTLPQPIPREYAMLTRIIDGANNRVIITIGGMNHVGTQISGELLCDAAFWAEMARTAPPDWRRKNIQVVLETEVSGNRPVHPRVIATHYW